jgi:uncharacterized RmlC-like cupin family protein
VVSDKPIACDQLPSYLQDTLHLKNGTMLSLNPEEVGPVGAYVQEISKQLKKAGFEQVSIVAFITAPEPNNAFQRTLEDSRRWMQALGGLCAVQGRASLISRRRILKGSLSIIVIVFGLIACVSDHTLQSKVSSHVILFNSEQAAWEPGGGPGSVRAAIIGDPSKSGPYLHVIKVPANTRSAAHKYSDSRTYTIVAGTWYVGFGDQFDDAKLIALPPGSYYALPAGVSVFNATKDDGATIQIGGTGPSEHIDIEPTR